MYHSHIINELARNGSVFHQLLTGVPADVYKWRPSPDKWCLLEIVSHLYDEEREDFRARVKSVLENPGESLKPIDPVGWVQSRHYMEQDYEDRLAEFLNERESSVEWLSSLRDPVWQNAYQHPTFGEMTADMLLANWLAHDYLHIRQIVRTKRLYLQFTAEQNLDYAGSW